MNRSLYRRSVQQIADSPSIRRLVTEAGFPRRLVERFVAGDTLDDAIACAQTLNRAGMTVSLDYLGELISSREEAIVARQTAIRSLKRMVSEGISGNISVKPTQLGLVLDESFCVDNLEAILTEARNLGDGVGELFVRLDMESSEYTEGTIRLVEDLWVAGYRNVGTVVQSCLHRTIDDIRRLTRLGSRVRLVKGAYTEPPSIAYQVKADVDRLFVRGMKMLLQDGNYPAIATHDEAMIEATRNFAFEHGIPRDSFEFQMLYGVRRDLQHRLREEGYNVRVYMPYGDAWYPYLMRRMAERPANLFFLANSLIKETPLRMFARPVGIGAGVVAGVAATLAWRARRSR